MRLFVFIIIIFQVCLCYADTWDITEIYEAKEAPYKSKALDNYGKPITSYGNLTNISKILVPCSLDYGRYRVTITEIEPKFYQINGTNYYLEMNGTNYFGPTSIINKSADVILINEGYLKQILYDR